MLTCATGRQRRWDRLATLVGYYRFLPVVSAAQDDLERRVVRGELIVIGLPAVEPLIAVLKDGDWHVAKPRFMR